MNVIIFYSMGARCGHCVAAENALKEQIDSGKIIKKDASEANGKFQGFPAFECDGKTHMGGVPSYETLLEKLGLVSDTPSSNQEAAIVIYIEDWCGYCTKAKKILEDEIASGLILVKQAKLAVGDGVTTNGVPHFISLITGEETAGCPQDAPSLLEKLGMTTEGFMKGEYNCQYGGDTSTCTDCCETTKNAKVAAAAKTGENLSMHWHDACITKCSGTNSYSGKYDDSNNRTYIPGVDDAPSVNTGGAGGLVNTGGNAAYVKSVMDCESCQNCGGESCQGVCCQCMYNEGGECVPSQSERSDSPVDTATCYRYAPSDYGDCDMIGNSSIEYGSNTLGCANEKATATNLSECTLANPCFGTNCTGMPTGTCYTTDAGQVALEACNTWVKNNTTPPWSSNFSSALHDELVQSGFPITLDQANCMSALIKTHFGGDYRKIPNYFDITTIPGVADCIPDKDITNEVVKKAIRNAIVKSADPVKSGLSVLQIVLIVLGVLVVVGLLGFGAYKFMNKKNAQPQVYSTLGE